jgi:CRISPR-associated protein Cas1
MRKILNTLFVTSENAYASLENNNIVLTDKGVVLGKFPLLILESIYLFTYAGASPALMGKCAEMSINLVFCSPYGKFLARSVGEQSGNVLLRRTQYRYADQEDMCCLIAKNFIFGKVYNSRKRLNRIRRDHKEIIQESKFRDTEDQLKSSLKQILSVQDMESLRGIEGAAASAYFNRFNDMILRNKEEFFFHGRNRRPPNDNVNALMSYVYMMLERDCAAGLEMAGLDPFVGFMHTDRPGRESLALDLMEELRPYLADRMVLFLINNGVISSGDFDHQENGTVMLNMQGKQIVQKQWQSKKQEKIKHPYLKQKVERGMLPYIQALLLSRFLRGDIDGYPPFLEE